MVPPCPVRFVVVGLWNVTGGVPFCNSTAQRGILCRLIIKAISPALTISPVLTTSPFSTMLAPLLSCVLPLRLPRQPASVFHDVRQWCCWPVPVINRKAAAVFQQQAAGLTGYAINTELTAGIGPGNSGTTVFLQSGHHQMSW